MENEYSPYPPVIDQAWEEVQTPQEEAPADPPRLGLLTIPAEMPEADLQDVRDQVLIALHRIDENLYRIADMERRLNLILSHAFGSQVPREFQEQGPGSDDL